MAVFINTPLSHSTAGNDRHLVFGCNLFRIFGNQCSPADDSRAGTE